MNPNVLLNYALFKLRLGSSIDLAYQIAIDDCECDVI
jgi:hypothetical protein